MLGTDAGDGGFALGAVADVLHRILQHLLVELDADLADLATISTRQPERRIHVESGADGGKTPCALR